MKQDPGIPRHDARVEGNVCRRRFVLGDVWSQCIEMLTPAKGEE